jgi:uncharacterized membrane protein
MRAWTDERMDRAIAGVLRGGVLLASALIAAGTALFLVRHGGEPASFAHFRGEPVAPRHVAGIVREALAARGRGLAQLGLLVLVATPIARVAFSVFAFAARRDRTYVGVTIGVLAILGFSLLGAHP